MVGGEKNGARATTSIFQLFLEKKAEGGKTAVYGKWKAARDALKTRLLHSACCGTALSLSGDFPFQMEIFLGLPVSQSSFPQWRSTLPLQCADKECLFSMKPSPFEPERGGRGAGKGHFNDEWCLCNLPPRFMACFFHPRQLFSH